RKDSLATQIYRDLYREDKDFEDVAGRLRDLGVTISEEPAKDVIEGTVFSEDISRSDEADTLKPGQTLGRYEVVKELGRGAMGIVYLCQDPTLERSVAIKTFKFSELADEEKLAKIKSDFIREAKLAGKLNHPHIVTIFDAGEDWDLSYIAMETIAGKELKEDCSPGNLLPIAEVIKTITTLAGTLDYAHKGGVIHRDIKPANIMVTEEGILKIMDFGIALVKGEIAAIAGTPSYMAPEQFKKEAVDGRTDLYALGIIFYELLTGGKPFQATDVAALKEKIINQPVSDLIREKVPGPPEIHNIIERLLEKDKEKRFATGEELAGALEQIEISDDGASAQEPAGETTKEGEATVVFDETVADIGQNTTVKGEDP
ncbi:MAG: serine/threonine-protein kinase, partial [Desulfobacterales bacterium]